MFSAIRFDKDNLFVDLLNGRTICVPLSRYPRLAAAEGGVLQNWIVAGAGYGIHWPDLDEDLSIDGLLRGAPSPELRSD